MHQRRQLEGEAYAVISLLYHLKLTYVQVYWDVRPCGGKKLLTPCSGCNKSEVVDLVQDTDTQFHITNLPIATAPYPSRHESSNNIQSISRLNVTAHQKAMHYRYIEQFLDTHYPSLDHNASGKFSRLGTNCCSMEFGEPKLDTTTSPPAALTASFPR
jgi:hypothetical protein